MKKVGYCKPLIQTVWLWRSFSTSCFTVIHKPYNDFASLRSQNCRKYMKQNPKGFGHRQKKFINRGRR